MSQTQVILKRVWASLNGPEHLLASVSEQGQGAYSSRFAVTDFATASIAAAGLALAEWIEKQSGQAAPVLVDRRLSSLWFAKSIRPMGWALPPQWDPVSGNYATKDGFIRLHTNAERHRHACLRVLETNGQRENVTKAVQAWEAEALQEAIIAEGGVAAKMLTAEEWSHHQQGQAVAREPLALWSSRQERRLRSLGTEQRPLAGLKVLDLTRILAGPIGTRFLAAFGADVLRIDPPFWDEPAVLPEVTPGKKCARLNLHHPADREIFSDLIGQADVLVHGYRADALEQLGFGDEHRLQLNPNLIDVALNAYGWNGPWHMRRGFDTIVQMSAGLAAAEMDFLGKNEPQQLPVQVLDYGTGHLMAAAVLRALVEAQQGRISKIRFSLARTAQEVLLFRNLDPNRLVPETPEDLASEVEKSFWGDAKRLKAPVHIGAHTFVFERPAGPLGRDRPCFS